MESEQQYTIPLKYRKMENLHIVFWLFKDIAWCMIWQPLGLAMVLPTMVIAIIIAWRTRENTSELCHNLAVVCWITANSYWMISEFFTFDGYELWGDWSYKYLSLVPFTAGILILAFYYIWWKPRHKQEMETM